MAFMNKLKDLAKNIGDKTTDVIETTKLSNKINSERLAADVELKRIGTFYYERFARGEEIDPEILQFCQMAQAHYIAATEAQTEIDRIKAESETAAPAAAPAAAAAAVCPACGAGNAPGTKFCRECGAKLEASEEKKGSVCPACGAKLEEGLKFCGECGHKIE